MFKIATVSPEDATGPIADLYGLYPDSRGIPEVVRLMTASPGFLAAYGGMMDFWKSHKTLSFHVLAAIRYLASEECQFNCCIDHNAQLLMASGMSGDELIEMKKDPRNGPFEPRENELLAFVLDAMRDKAAATPERIEKLRELGWTDPEIFEATFHGVGMKANSQVFDIFKSE